MPPAPASHYLTPAPGEQDPCCPSFRDWSCSAGGQCHTVACRRAACLCTTPTSPCRCWGGCRLQRRWLWRRRTAGQHSCQVALLRSCCISWGAGLGCPCAPIPVDLVRQGHTPQQQPGLCSGVAASAAGTLFRASSFSSSQAAMLAHRYLDPRAGAPSIVAAQLVTGVAGAGLAVFAKSPSILWPVPLHEQLVRHGTPTCVQLSAVMQVARQVAEPLHGSSCQYCWVVMCHGVHTLCAVLRQNML